MSADICARLAAPFPPSVVSWRVGTSNKKKLQREQGPNAKATKGQVLAYIDARDVMDRFDEVCGPAGWQNRYTHADKKTVCEIGVKLDGEWIWKADGAGDSDIEAEKGSLSDAFKRAAVRWGVGRYLYHLPTPWVDLDDREQISDAERRKLEGLLTRAAGSSTPPQQQSPKTAQATGRAPANGAPKPSLADRANALEQALKACTTKPKADATWNRASALCAQLDTADPERLAELEALYKLTGLLPDTDPPTPPAEPNDFGLNGDDLPSFN